MNSIKLRQLRQDLELYLDGFLDTLDTAEGVVIATVVFTAGLGLTVCLTVQLAILFVRFLVG